MNSCVFCLPVYNSEYGLSKCLQHIKTLQKYFNQTKILVFYDNSKDGSLELLLKNRESMKIEIYTNTEPKHKQRVKNICKARNFMLDIIKEKYSHFEFFICMDTNNYSCIGDINEDVFKMVMARKDEWDAISFDREAGYYDTWALSFNPYIYSIFHMKQKDKYIKNMRENFNKIKNEYHTNLKGSFLQVYSAFNGFAIYKTNFFTNCKYSTIIDHSIYPPGTLDTLVKETGLEPFHNMDGDCEHRNFHLESIKFNNARIMICFDSLIKKVPNPPKFCRGEA